MSNNNQDLAGVMAQYEVSKENWHKDLSTGLVILASAIVSFGLHFMYPTDQLVNLSYVGLGFLIIGAFLFSDGPYYHKKTAELRKKIAGLQGVNK